LDGLTWYKHMRAVSVSRSNRDARTKEEPALNLWLREIPASGIALSSPSLEAYADGFVLAVSDLRWCAAGLPRWCRMEA
jgi:hypothetical protein